MTRLYRKRVFSLIICAIMVLCTAGIDCTKVRAADMMGHPVMENVLDAPEIEEGEDESLPKSSVSYPKVYDPRNKGKVTSVKDQGMYNTCWAFATVSAIESNLIKKGMADKSIDLSESHMAYFFYNRRTDALGYTKYDKNISTRSSWRDNGGTITGNSVALTTWAGVITDNKARYPYKPNNKLCYEHDYVVKNTYNYTYKVSNVKRAITEHGAVVSGIYMDERYFNPKTNAYYCNIIDGNHAVSIVGWDDNYSRNNFNGSIRPKSNGAWIVKNSYGSFWGDSGYMYVSYEDTTLDEIIAFDMVKNKNSYDNNYQHDGTGSCVYTYNLSKGEKLANVFTANASKKYVEVLKAVSVNAYTTNARYYLQVYTGLTNASNPESGKAMFSKPQTGILKDSGYIQIPLEKQVTLAAGEKFSVVMWFSSSKPVVKIGVDASYDASWIKFNSYTGRNKSFISSGHYWTDCAGSDDVVVRIKAFTDNTKKVPQYKINKRSVLLSRGSTTKLSVITNPASLKRNVKWTSSNRKVATVSKNGRVKGKSIGNATIKAKFQAGGSVKTFVCKVTVQPPSVKGFRASGGKGNITVRWNPEKGVSGYRIYFSEKMNGKYRQLKAINGNGVKSYTEKMKKGTYYVKMCSYYKSGSKAVNGKFTDAKMVKVK